MLMIESVAKELRREYFYTRKDKQGGRFCLI